jgi:hypothetical protein
VVERAQQAVYEEGGRRRRETLAQEQALLEWVDQPLGEYVGLTEIGAAGRVRTPAP